jgi:hypothetical protein
MVHDRDLFSFPIELRALVQSTSTLKTFYHNFGPSFRRINDHFRPLIPAFLFDIILGR